jgi:hypothetical protein
MAQLKVSDHAIIRYFERVLELDLSDIRKELASDLVTAQYKALGDGKFPISSGNGHRAVVVNSTVVSVIKS